MMSFSKSRLLALLLLSVSLVAGCHRLPFQKRPNVLVITLDTTRADHIGSYGYSLAPTPLTDRLASEGIRCSDAISAAPITMPAHSSIFTGLYPPAHSVRDNGSFALPDSATTLAERLKAAGYTSHALLSAL